MSCIINVSRRAVCLSSTAIAVLACSAGSVAAQDIDRAASAGSSGQLQAIIVTAQRRSENIQDVPVAVTAVAPAIIENTNLSRVTDLGVVVPSLTVTNTNGKLSTSLRGIGSTGVAPGFENPVALYVDGVYLAATLAPFQGLSDVAQVEVLKGPQGTLFGRNATGGLIQIITRTPTQDTALSANLSYGNYDTVEGDLYLAGGLAPGLAASISAYGLHQGDGWGTNLTTGADTYKVDHNISLRGKLAMELGATTKAVLSLDYTDESRNDIVGGALPGRFTTFSPAVRAPDIGYDQVSNEPTFKNSWSVGGNLTVDQEIGSLTLKSITAYRESEAHIGLDLDQTALATSPVDYKQPEDQFSQEFQLQSGSTGQLQWVAGLYYFNYHGGYDPLQIPAFGVTLINYQKAESYAAYAQGTYEILPETKLTLGGRFTTEERTEYGPIFPQRKLNFDKFTFRASLDHRFSPEALAYVSFNRGFKSGGFSTASPGAAPFSPESVDAYEVGLKTDLFDRRARVNLAAYYYDYTNIQNFIFISASATAIRNAASAHIYGADMDFQIKATSNLDISGGLSVNSAKYQKYDNAPLSDPDGGVPSVAGSAAGNYLPLAAKFTANLAATYKIPVGDGEVAATVNGSYNSGFFFEADNVSKQPRYALVGANVDWTVGNSGFSVGAFVRNLTDQRVIAHTSTMISGNASVIYSAPRTYGARIRYRF